jgi:hypothetical protein
MAGSGFLKIFYGRFHIQMFQKACLRGKEHFNLLIWDPYRPEDFLFPVGLPAQTKKKIQILVKNSRTICGVKSP